jgi:hypothetical protein
MAAVLRKRPCRFCRRWFLPDVRLGGRQYACSAQPCQAKRQAENQQAWLDGDPGYFRKNRGAKHRAYRAAHPEAKRLWRERNPDVRERERVARAKRRRSAPTRRAVAQEAIVLQLVDSQRVTKALAPAVTQESIVTQLQILTGLASALAPAVAQESIAGALLAWNDRGRQILAGAVALEPVRPRREAAP